MQTNNDVIVLHGKLTTDEVILHGQMNVQVHAAGFELEELPLGHALKWDDRGRLAVEVATEATEDNTLPITSAAVQTALGNIDVLLQTI